MDTSDSFPDDDVGNAAVSGEPAQEVVFALLADPATHGGGPVLRCDTHASAVFLAPRRAYKVKRAVQFPFLDYSTLPKRKAACEAELVINHQFAPRLYRQVVAITRESNGQLAVGGKGEPVEWAVEMERFDESRTLDHIAARSAFDDTLPAKLAHMVTAMHQRAECTDPDPWLAALPRYIEQNTNALREASDLFPAEAVSELDQRSRNALARIRPLLVSRGQRGLTRRGHGDLHLGNIVLLDGEPVPFDAIEFDPVMASGDILYDLSFLLMDLIAHTLTPAANVVLNGYFAATHQIEDYDGLAALPLFMSIRAAVRAKVTAARLSQNTGDKRNEIIQAAQRYFELARILIAPPSPSIVCVGGLSGTGKSILARSLAPLIHPLPGAIVLRSDVERKTWFGVDETDRLPPEAYRPEISTTIYAMLCDKAARIARAGHSVIVDAVFAKASERAAIEAVAREANVTFHGLFLEADLATRIARISGRGPDASDANPSVARQQEGFEVGSLSWSIINAAGSPADTLARACDTLPEP